ncbi:MAG TPA: nucleotide exchange factor GrpE, partial [Acidimicrobiia bacterium]|nr:nucleotide exchange factor GrpE [Acidimicrobiia bacterium]
DDNAGKLKKGVELVYAELLAVLERSGLERVDALGRPFDPNEHEAVMRDEGDGDPVVTEVMRQGYRFRGRVLRPAMVRVGAAG